MTDILEPFWTEETKKIIEQSRQVLEQLKKRRKKNLFQKISLIHIREIKLSEKLILNSGDIILRPLKNLNSDWNLDLNHYGIVFGTTIDNKKLILEITSENNVGIVYMKRFLNGNILKIFCLKKLEE